MKAPDESLNDLAGAILDGTPIDWPATETDSGNDQALVDQLRVLAAVAELHRQSPAPPAPSSGVKPLASTVFPNLERWGPLRVVEPIGRGSCGTVYRAWDTHLDREVALKLLPVQSVAENGDANAVVHEGRMLARVRHPNVVTVYGAEHIENQIGLWMEFVRGETLEHALEKNGTFGAAEVIEIGIQLCQAVSAVHAAGLLHRDIKAHNVARAEDGRVVLMDFGAGRDAADHPASDLTGTPLYLAPEIFDGHAASVRSDVYSLGVLLYHLVTGSYPVPGRNLKELRDRHRRNERVPIDKAGPGLPAPLVRVIERATSRDPEVRYETAAAMGSALAATVGNNRQPSRHWIQVALIGGLAAAIAVTIAAVLLPRSSAESSSTRNEWAPITDFSDSATQPSISPDGRMVAFIRGSGWFQTPGQIYVKTLPDGEPRRLTDDQFDKMSPVFSPDGSQLAYTTVDRRTFRWDTQIVPVHGSDPPRLLANASGLTWIDSGSFLFSEIKAGVHMALVTADDKRDRTRDLYVPPHARGMVHRSALSPDGKWVLAVEMENQLWLPCRLLPFDGRSPGKPIGPAAPCIGAAWSPDGAWMYVNANSGGSFHIWRQRFPDGEPTQVTSGPTEETGLALAPDGRSLVTSVGITASSVWVHDRKGERQISSEGNGHIVGAGPLEARPRASYFSPDDNKLYYLTHWGGGSTFLDGQLWVADLSSGLSERVLPDFTVASFDVSDDGSRVVFAAAENGGKPHLWLAWLDQRSPPRRISEPDHDHPLFAPNGEIIFRVSEGGLNFMYRMNEDGTNRRKIVATPILGLQSVSPDGRWVAAFAPAAKHDGTLNVFGYPTDGGPAVRICATCKVSWSRDGSRLYISDHEDRTHVVGLREAVGLPDLPSEGLQSARDFEALPVIEVIEQALIAPGRAAGVYAFTKLAVQRNLYRIPLP